MFDYPEIIYVYDDNQDAIYTLLLSNEYIGANSKQYTFKNYQKFSMYKNSKEVWRGDQMFTWFDSFANCVSYRDDFIKNEINELTRLLNSTPKLKT